MSVSEECHKFKIMFKSNSHKMIREASSDKVCKYISVLLKRIKNKKLVSQLSLCQEKRP